MSTTEEDSKKNKVPTIAIVFGVLLFLVLVYLLLPLLLKNKNLQNQRVASLV